jgi:phospholipid/cholesterol/gamma-HCH transport system permease protein
MTTTNNTAPTLQQTIGHDGRRLLSLGGLWTLQALEPRIPALSAELKRLSTELEWHWDLSGIQALDAAGAMLLWHAWGRNRPQRLTVKPEQDALFLHFSKLAGSFPRKPRDLTWYIAIVGQLALKFYSHAVGMIILLGQLLLNFAYIATHPKRIPWKEISANLYRTGAQALGITGLLGFLIGIVLSYLSAQQLAEFGAETYIVPIVGLGILRELGPVITAILVAGRSGSAMTAQLGVMRVTQELDALAVMGIPHTQRLVLPKVIALGIALPLLILWTDAIALIGGMAAAKLELGISFTQFLDALQHQVPVENLFLGVAKGTVFGILIAFTACHFGLRIKPDTESLGLGTTSAVVTSITIVIIVDACFAVIFSGLGVSL